jgi:polyhydroxyalkanoate synthase subunit PhaC
VVYRNRMLELIQYEPTTPKVHKTPLLIFPPWINKFYIMDLKAQNSLIKWIVDQGFTLFVVSWVNPDQSYAGIGMDDYIRDGFMRAIAEVRRITGEKEINAVGYCIAGTTLGLTLAYLQKAGDNSVKSATFFTTLADFSDPGEVGVFLNDDFVDGIERQTALDGILSRKFMSKTFSFLRSNDLIYTPAIKSYMLGEAPPAFDLLYWNGDGTNLPAKMAVEYLRGLCQGDGFAKGEYKVFGHPVSLADIKLPLCAIACETDHIAHWRGQLQRRQADGVEGQDLHPVGAATSPASSTRRPRTSTATTPTTVPSRATPRPG